MTARRALALGAHPDDIEIYCLGTLLLLQQAGWEIGWVVATDGQAGLPPGAETGVRRQEALAAGARVGITPHLLGLQDGLLHDGADEVAALRLAVESFKPTLIIAPSPNDYHPDHRALSRLASAVCPMNAALLWMDTMLGVEFLPDLSIDVTPTYACKLECLRLHRTQVSDAALSALTTWHAFRALQMGRREVRHAEAFRVDKAAGRPDMLWMLGDLGRVTALAQNLAQSDLA